MPWEGEGRRGQKFLLKKTGEEQKGSLLSCGAEKQRESEGGRGERGDEGRGLDRVSEAASFLCIYFLGGRSRRRRGGKRKREGAFVASSATEETGSVGAKSKEEEEEAILIPILLGNARRRRHRGHSAPAPPVVTSQESGNTLSAQTLPMHLLIAFPFFPATIFLDITSPLLPPHPFLNLNPTSLPN